MTSYTAPANFNPIFDPKKFIEIPTANIDSDINTDAIQTQIYNMNAEAAEENAVFQSWSTYYDTNVPITGLASGVSNNIYSITPKTIGVYFNTATVNFTIPAGVAWTRMELWCQCVPYSSQYSNGTFSQCRVFYNTKDATNGTITTFTMNIEFYLNCVSLPTTLQYSTQLYSTTPTTYSVYVANNSPAAYQYAVSNTNVNFTQGINPYLK
jgi:hypothetical protein